MAFAIPKLIIGELYVMGWEKELCIYIGRFDERPKYSKTYITHFWWSITNEKIFTYDYDPNYDSQFVTKL